MQENTTGPIARVHVTGDGRGVTGQAGTHLLGRIANRLGVAEGLSEVMDGTTMRALARDRGIVLTQLAMMVAGGGRCVSDLATLRDQPVLFGDVASDATVWRTVNDDLADDGRRHRLVGVRQAATRRLLAERGVDGLTRSFWMSTRRCCIWTRRATAGGGDVQGRLRGAPMLCFVEPFGLPAGMLRGGGATANNAGDQLGVVDQAIAALPDDFRAGHQPGDDPHEVARRVVVRADTAGGTSKMVTGLTDRNLVQIQLVVGMRASQAAAEVIKAIDDDAWQPASRCRHTAQPIKTVWIE